MPTKPSPTSTRSSSRIAKGAENRLPRAFERRPRTGKLSTGPFSIALACALFCGCEANPRESPRPAWDWAPIEPKIGGFRASFPRPPEFRSEPAHAARGLTVEGEHAQLTFDGYFLSASAVRLSGVKDYHCASGLDSMIEASMRSMGCTASPGEVESLATYEAKTVSFECQKRPAQGRLRVTCDARELGTSGVVLTTSALATAAHTRWSEDEVAPFWKLFEPIRWRTSSEHGP